MGPEVVVKRIAFIAGGIAHSMLGGMGAAHYFGFPPLGGALAAAIAAALLIGWVRLRWQTQEDTLIGALWAIGMAVGILFISKTPGYQSDLMSYLFGSGPWDSPRRWVSTAEGPLSGHAHEVVGCPSTPVGPPRGGGAHGHGQLFSRGPGSSGCRRAGSARNA